jgi:hypothetical protein
MPQVFARFQRLAELLASTEGRALSDLALARLNPGDPGVTPELEVLHDWLTEHGVETARTWLAGRLRLASQSGGPLASAVWL